VILLFGFSYERCIVFKRKRFNDDDYDIDKDFKDILEDDLDGDFNDEGFLNESGDDRETVSPSIAKELAKTAVTNAATSSSKKLAKKSTLRVCRVKKPHKA
jgi:hypothetical protein